MPVDIERIEQPAQFDYAVLDEPTQAFVQGEAHAIRVELKRTVEGALAIGHRLIAVKANLPHGMFLPWLHAEIDLSERTAQNFMHAARTMDRKSAESADLPVSLLHEPHSIIQMVETGQIAPTAFAIREAKQEVQPVQIEQQPVMQFAPESEKEERRNEHVMRIMGSSESPEWYTPQEIIDLVVDCFGEIDLDPCSNSHESPAVPARVRYTREENGLMQQWFGKVYMNPPYGSEIPDWVQSLVTYYEQGDVEEAIALLPARIDTQWFQPLYTYPMCNVRGRLQFSNAPHSAPFPSILVYLGRRPGKFIATFKDLGPIMGRIG